jgi:hypothetical protein
MFWEIKKILFAVAVAVLNFLPNSPFTAFLTMSGKMPFLGYLNYFLPIAECISIGEAWLACIAVFYSYQTIMRLVQLID